MAGSEDYKIKNLIATIILCTTLSTLSFIGRLWGRSLSAVSLGWDDFFMASAVLGGWVVSADNIVGIHFGSGRHVKDLSPSDVKNWTITFWTFNFLQIAATTVLKLAILGLYRRTFVTRSFHRAINVVTAIILADSLGLLIAESLYCVPAAHFWDPSIPGKCINRVDLPHTGIYFPIGDGSDSLLDAPTGDMEATHDSEAQVPIDICLHPRWLHMHHPCAADHRHIPSRLRRHNLVQRLCRNMEFGRSPHRLCDGQCAYHGSTRQSLQHWHSSRVQENKARTDFEEPCW
ncbi:hypothetical protein XPA_008274 [Xanthoria parietina]